MTQDAETTPQNPLKDQILKRMIELGYDPQANAFAITWQEIAGQLAEVLDRYQVPDEVVTDELLQGSLQRAENALLHSEALPWPYVIYMMLEEGVPEQYRQWAEPDSEPDEGPFTEQYENGARLGDVDDFFTGFDDYDDF